MTPTVQQLDPEADLARIAALLAEAEPQPPGAVELRALFARAVELRRLTGVSAPDGTLAGCCMLTRTGSLPEGEVALRVWVHPAQRRQGIGSALYDAACQYAREQRQTHLRVSVDDSEPDALRFAEQRGFVEQRHLIRQALDLEAFNPAPFAAALERALAAGIRFASLAELGDTPEARRQFYAMNKAASADIPNRGPFYSYAEYEAQRFGHPSFRADGMFAALAGDEFVGMAQVTIDEKTGIATNEMTGVLRSHRGHGLALALKLHTLRFAQAVGCVRIETFNDYNNPPILRLNRALGFQPIGGTRMLRAEIAPDAAIG